MPYLQELNDYLFQHVPLFRAMQARLERCDAAGLALAAPLAPNVNDKGTAFGGSMAAIAALTGWAITTITLREHGETAEIVIVDSTLKFLRPVRETIVAECVPPDAAAVEKFIQRYRQRGKARWTVRLKSVFPARHAGRRIHSGRPARASVRFAGAGRDGHPPG